MNKRKIDRILGTFAILTIFAAWIIGANLAEGDVNPALIKSYPEASRFDQIDDNSYAAIQVETEDLLLGYVAITTANGYGGPMRIAVAVDLEGNIHGLAVVKHKETPSWMKKVLDTDYLQSITGKTYMDSFQLDDDVDGITGATFTSRALAEAALKGSREVAGVLLNFDVPEKVKSKIIFGIPEITLIGLFALGYFGHQRKFKYTKQVRWISMITGMVILGFIYTNPLTLSDINKFLLGFWPEWQTNLYWYILLGGMLLVFTVDNKNPYCEWFCPFGAAQETMGIIGGAKPRSVGKSKNFMLWVQRGLAWLAIILALLFRNPGLSSYEIFGTFFDLTGSGLQFAVLGIILVASLFIRRPWCKYLCPMAPVIDLYRTFRKWIIELWKTRKNV
jgi:NosR/NirI family transcriptional regulator, nitrous oxide reductase regulator